MELGKNIPPKGKNPRYLTFMYRRSDIINDKINLVVKNEISIDVWNLVNDTVNIRINEIR